MRKFNFVGGLTYSDYEDKYHEQLESEFEEQTDTEDYGQFCYDKWESYQDDIADEMYQRAREEGI